MEEHELSKLLPKLISRRRLQGDGDAWALRSSELNQPPYHLLVLSKSNCLFGLALPPYNRYLKELKIISRAK